MAQAGWHPEEIKAQLRMRHGAITTLSQRWGYGRAGISRTLTCSSYSVAIERRIAEALGVLPQTVWPDRWHADGTPRRRTYSRPSGTKSNQNGKAA